jgi:hypothetical protein
MVDITGLTQEEFDDVQPALTIMLRMAKVRADAARDQLCNSRCSDYNEYLKRFYKLEACDEALADLIHLKERGKEPLK